MSAMGRFAVAALLLATGCNVARQRMPDNSYYAQNQNWVDDRGAPVPTMAPTTMAPTTPPPMSRTPATASVSSFGDSSPTGGSALEELQVARRDLASQNSELLEAREKIQSLTLTVDQLRQDNAKIQASRDALEAECETYRGAAGEREGDVAELERQLRQLADELLTERIARLRVERDLLLGKLDPLAAAGEDG